MAKHDPEMITRKGLNALPVAAPEVPEEDHFFTCQQCGRRVDYRRLGDVLYHDEPHAGPLSPVFHHE